jgi:hypothetical protein
VKIASTRRKSKVIGIVFSGTFDPSAIVGLSHYSLLSAGRDRRFRTRDDRALPLSNATYDASTHVLTLQPRQALSTAYPLKLTIAGFVSGTTYTALLGPRAKN